MAERSALEAQLTVALCLQTDAGWLQQSILDYEIAKDTGRDHEPSGLPCF